MTPTARSLARLKKDGWLADKVERREGPATHDLFGIGDILAIRTTTKPERVDVTGLDGIPTFCLGRDVKTAEVLLVQATTASNISARVNKIANSPHVGTVREAGIRIEVWGWKAPTKKRRTWDLRVVDCS